MFLELLKRKNPNLIRAAVTDHGEGDAVGRIGLQVLEARIVRAQHPGGRVPVGAASIRDLGSYGGGGVGR